MAFGLQTVKLSVQNFSHDNGEITLMPGLMGKCVFCDVVQHKRPERSHVRYSRASLQEVVVETFTVCELRLAGLLSLQFERKKLQRFM